jgi:hypothetical protein
MKRSRLTTSVLIVVALVGATLPVVAVAPSAAALDCDTAPPGAPCFVVDATVTRGAAVHRAQGFLHGIHDDSPNPTLVAALHPTAWRSHISQEFWDDSKGRYGGASTQLVTESYWESRFRQWYPAEDWAAYEQFVRDQVTASNAQGWPVDYWDIFNEPGLSPATCRSGVCANALLLEQVERTIDAGRSVDQDAAFVAPSTEVFRPTNPLGPLGVGRSLDLTTLLDHLVANDVDLDALSWHEIWSGSNEAGAVASPRSIVAHVTAARQLIAARPQLGPMEIHINEWGTPQNRLVPGWNAGYITAIEDADVDRANRSCWGDNQPYDLDGDGTIEADNGQGQNEQSVFYDECFGLHVGNQVRVLNGLFTLQGQPQADYWVHRFYADMAGTRVATSADDDFASAFATRDDATETVRVMAGRHYSCTPAVNPHCVGSPNVTHHDVSRTTPPPAAGAMSVKWPYPSGNVVVEVQRVPNVRGAVIAPTTVSTTTVAAVSGQSFEIALGNVADGEAITVTARPA